MAEQTSGSGDDVKRRFREALERKQGKAADGQGHAEGAGKSVHNETVAQRRTFRRRAGG